LTRRRRPEHAQAHAPQLQYFPGRPAINKILRNHLATCVAILLAIPIILGVFFTDFDFIDLGLKHLARIDNNELDEIVVAFLIVIGGMIADRVRARSLETRKLEIDAERLRVLKATMRTVQDLVNNFLQNMQLFHMEATDGIVSPESLKLLEELIFETAEKLNAIADVNEVIETNLASGPGVLPRVA
jgi:hypothetical protein